MEDVKDLIEKAMDLSPHGMMVVEGEQIKAVNWGAVILLDAEKKEEVMGKNWKNFFTFYGGEEDLSFIMGKMVTLKGNEKEIVAFFYSFNDGNGGQKIIIFQEESNADKVRQYLLGSISRKMNKMEAFYKIISLAKDAKTLDEILGGIAEIVPSLMRHPELAFSKIIFRGKKYAPYGDGEGDMKEDIIVDGVKEGAIIAGYMEEIPGDEKTRAIKEDAEILKEVACHIGEIISLREAREEKEKNRLYFQTILEKSSDITMVVDENAVIKFITPSIKEVLGFQPEEVIGKSALSFIHLEDMDACIWQHRKMLENPSRAIRAMYRIQTKEGEWKFVEIVGRNMLDDPAINGLIFNFHDITERVMVEKKLEENERKLRSILDATHDMVLLASVDETDFGKILEINDAMAESLGKSKSELKGTNIKEHLPADVYEKRTAKVFEVMKTGMPVEFEDTRAGKWFHNVFYPIFDYDGKVKQIAIFTRDITLEKKMMEELERSRIYFQTLLEKGWDVVMVHDENAKSRYSDECS